MCGSNDAELIQVEAFAASVLLRVDKSFLARLATCGAGRTVECFLHHALVMQVEERQRAAYIAEHILEGSLCRLHISFRVHKVEGRRRQRFPIDFLSTRRAVLIGGSLLVLRQTAVILLLSDIAVNIDALRSRTCTFQLQIHQR